MNKLLRILPLVPLLTACLPSTVAELKVQSSPDHFVIERNYQAVYRDLLAFLNGCTSGGFLFSTNQVQGNLYPDLSLAEITISNNNMGDKSTMLRIEVRGEQGMKAEVTTYSAPVGIWKHYDRRIRANVERNDGNCSD